MQVHWNGAIVPDGPLPVSLNEGTVRPFAVIKLADIEVFAFDAADCDEIIKAAVEAKRLLSGEPEWCPAVTDLDGETLYCDREPGHAGSHHAPGPDEGSEVAWSDEPAPEDPPRGEYPYPDTDAMLASTGEGITGLYWDSLGSSGSAA